MNQPDKRPGAARRRPVTKAQWAAARNMGEGEPSTQARIAATLGVSVNTVYARAAAEGWRTVDYRYQDVVALHREAVELSASYRAARIGAPADGGERPTGGAASSGEPSGSEPANGEGTGGEGTGGERTGAGPVADAPATTVAGAAVVQGASAPDAAEVTARASRFVAQQILILMERANRRGGRLDKAQIDGLAAMSRMLERWSAAAGDRRMEEGMKSDDELAGLLADIDARIVELARAEADRLCSGGGAGQAV